MEWARWRWPSRPREPLDPVWDDPPSAETVRDRVIAVAVEYGWGTAELHGSDRFGRPEDLPGWGWRVLTTVCAERADAQDGVVAYAQDCLSQGGYDDLLRAHGAATAGEWTPGGISEIWSPPAPGGQLVVLEFDGGRERHRWQFAAQSDTWVDASFLDLVDGYARRELTGRFVDVPSEDDLGIRLYLPGALVHAVDRVLHWPDPHRLVSAVRASGGTGPGWARLVDPMLWHCHRLGLTPDAASTTPAGELPLVVAARSGPPEAVEVLLRLGADPQARDRSGASAIDVADDPATAHVLARWTGR